MFDQRITTHLDELRNSGNLRALPAVDASGCVDFTSNDYLGLAQDLDEMTFAAKQLTASASRLLALSQTAHRQFEDDLQEAYGRPALLFNSGYHANVGIIQALASVAPRTLIVADRLVHASIIDGIRLSGVKFTRFAHNDLEAARRIVAANAAEYDNILLIVESVYSMDGDSPDMAALVDIKKQYPNVVLYVDEAHAVGVCGPRGLGLAQAYPEVDVIIGTLGKALASVGAYAVLRTSVLKEYLINKTRSLIFSTALPPANVLWSRRMFLKMMSLDARREHLDNVGRLLATELGRQPQTTNHIQCVVTGSAQSAMSLSATLAAKGFKALPIRYPTVPRGTERIRLSLSAVHTAEQVKALSQIIKDETSVDK